MTETTQHNGNLIRLHEEKMDKLDHRMEKLGDNVFRTIKETKDDLLCRLDADKEDAVKRIESVEKNVGRIPWILLGLIVNIGLTIITLLTRR